MMADDRGEQRRTDVPDTIEMPASTAWPFTVACGIGIGLVALVTHPALGLLGAAVVGVGAVGWAREVIPHAQHVSVRLRRTAAGATGPARVADRGREAGDERHRMRVPVEAVPYFAGVRGGLAGAAAMAAVAIGYGLWSQGSPWYPINLLAAVAIPSLASADLETLRAFHTAAFAVASLVHLAVSSLVGLLYVVLLPMLPGSPLGWSIFAAPLLWTAGLRLSLRIVNPALDARIDWLWFVASQIAFGLVCGLVVLRSERVRTLQSRPLADRLGLEVGSGGRGQPEEPR